MNNKEMIPIKRITALILALVLALSLTACGKKKPDAASSENAFVDVFANAEELNYNPLTGEALPSGVAAGRRPVAVMVNNAQSALPQRGVANAEAVIEMVTEGGITRLMALYSDAAAVPQVGSVRSARDQHLQFAIPMNAIVVHIGTSIYASNLLNTYAYQTIDGRYLGTAAFLFDDARATTRASEHCWYTDAAHIATGIEHEQLAASGKSFPLVNFMAADAAARTPAAGDAPDVIFQYSDANQVEFVYSADSGLYTKLAYGAEHRDEEGEQLAFKNVLILFADIGMKEDNYCSDFNLGSGTGFYVYGGKYEPVTWKKGNPETPLTILDEKGKELPINTGKTYLGVVGADRKGSVQMDKNAPVTPEATDSSAAAPAA
ncbi:MAG: DUF3048 domain-containing protein [Ruthenibacterium sp.]